MFVSDNAKTAECLGRIFKNLGINSFNVGNKIAANVMSNPRQTIEIRKKIGSAGLSKIKKKS